MSISWTPHEKQKLADEYSRLRAKTEYSQEACLETAMVILPEHRRKNVKDCSSKILRHIGIPAETPRPSMRKPQPRATQKKAKPVPVPYTNGTENMKPPGSIGIATEYFVAEIAKEVAGVIGLQVMASIRGHVDSALYGMFDRLVENVSIAVLKEVGEVVRKSAIPPRQEPAPAQPVQNITVSTSAPLDPNLTSLAIAPRNRKPRVAIIGLMSQQQQEIRKEFGEVCELTFLQSQTLHVNQLNEKDMAFIMVKFSKHSAEESCRTRSLPFYRVTGGVSHLRQEIRKWINGEIAITEVSNAA